MMTKLRKIILIPALFIVCISGFFSCGVDRWTEYAPLTELDSWMYDIMQENYLWHEDMPAYGSLNLFLEPNKFLAEVRSPKDSYSFVDSIMETPLPTYGFDYSLVRNTDIDTAYNVLVTYVIPQSPAAKAGLKRGDWIMKIDTSYISKKYEVQMLQGTKAADFVMGTWEEVITPPENPQELADTTYKVVPNDITLKMGVAQIVEDNPVHEYKILTLDNGSKVGYLMYNSFIAGTKSEPEKYNDQLREVSKVFGQANVQATILDLRYNAGGSIDCVQLLGSILTPSSRLGTPMAFLEYNAKNTNKDMTLNFEHEVLKNGVNLNQNLLFVITSGTTAGASEMLINSLYQEEGELGIIAIGSATKGQTVATERFDNDKYLWSVNPVVCTVYNSQHSVGGSWTPANEFKISETSINGETDYTQFLPFGDPKERMLNIVIQTLEGKYPPMDKSRSSNTTPTARFKIEKSVSSSASLRFVGGGGLQINK